MSIALSLVALAAFGAWVVLIILAGRPGAAHPRRLNGGLLLATVAASVLTCAAPVVPLVASFKEVAQAAPGEKAAALERGIEADRPAMPLALLSLPILGLGVAQHLANRRRLRGGPERP